MSSTLGVLLVCKVRHLISFRNCELVRIFGCSYPCKSHFQSDSIDSNGFPLGKFASIKLCQSRTSMDFSPHVAVVNDRRSQPLNSRSDAERRAGLEASWTGLLSVNLAMTIFPWTSLDFFYIGMNNLHGIFMDFPFPWLPEVCQREKWWSIQQLNCSFIPNHPHMRWSRVSVVRSSCQTWSLASGRAAWFWPTTCVLWKLTPSQFINFWSISGLGPSFFWRNTKMKLATCQLKPLAVEGKLLRIPSDLVLSDLHVPWLRQFPTGCLHVPVATTCRESPSNQPRSYRVWWSSPVNFKS